MIKTLKLAFSYLSYYKKQTLSLLIGVTVSAALTTATGSLLYSGKLADMERLREIYGDAHYQFDISEGNFTELQKHLQENDGSGQKAYSQENPFAEWTEQLKNYDFSIESAGILTVKKVTDSLTFAYADSGYMKMFRRTLLEGTFPQKPGETALAERTIRNLGMDKAIGSKVTLDGDTYTLCGIISDQWDENSKDMKAFVSADTELEEESSYLYVKFEETGDVRSQAMAFSDYFHFDYHKMERISDLTSYVGGDVFPSVSGTFKTALALPEGKLAYFWGTLNQSHRLTDRLILAALGLFAAFVIFSLYQVSVTKRMSQYSILETLGMDGRHTFGLLLSELYMILLAGYPVGAAAGNLAADILYSHMGEIFVDQSIGTIQNKVHSASARDVAAQIKVTPGEFHVSSSAVTGCALFLMFLMLFVSFFVIRRMRRFTWSEMITQNTHSRNQKHRIYSLKHSNMTGILSRKFLFERKEVFLGVIISLSLGQILFLGTAYVVENTKIHNALAFKADDGLASDIQVYEDSHKLSDVIPQEAADSLDAIDGIAFANPVRYTLGEIPLENGIFKWPEYYPETAGEKGFEQEAYIMERYNGIITKQSEMDYRLKANVYGYQDQMLEELEDYLLEGAIDPQSMIQEDTVVLKTLMDGQGNYDGIDIHPGDTLRLKVLKDASLPDAALRFDSPEDWYLEKEFRVTAIVSRALGKNDNYIGNEGNSTASIIMTNRQMLDDFGIEGYDSISITLEKDANHDKVSDGVRAAVNGIPNCLVKDYTQLIEQQNSYLRQKMFFFYGIAVILFLISIFHILNSMQYLVVSRTHEFGILRAMGITDAGLRKILLKEGLCYGVCSGIFLTVLYIMVQKVLYYALTHVFLYLHSNAGLPLLPLISIVVLNILICIAAMLWAGKDILDGNVIEEINEPAR